MKIQLIQGDCIEELPKLKADLIITSPPYNMNLRIRNGKYCSRQIVKEISTKYNNYADNLPMEDYFEWQKSFVEAALLTAPIVFYNVQFLTGNKRALFKLMGYFNESLKEIIVWNKINAQPAIGDGVLNSQWEAILVLDRDNAISRRFHNGRFKRGTLSNLWSIKRDKPKPGHGATLPAGLIKTIILNFTNERNIILDPFMGTGTVGISCVNHHRNFIGIEIDNDYFRLAQTDIYNNYIDKKIGGQI